MTVCDREYATLRERHIGRHRNRHFEPFSTWLERKVDKMHLENVPVTPELRHMSQLPLSIVTEHHRIWAYGNHFRTEDSILGNTYLSFDSGVACVAATQCQASPADIRLVEAQLKYVGILRKILQLNYVYRKVNVFECSWIKPNILGNQTIKQDSHGFWLVKKGAFQGPRAEPYILPAHASQVIFTSHPLLAHI